MNNQNDARNPSQPEYDRLSDEFALIELQQAKDAAEKALQFKNDYFAKISHEVRTPLNAVIGVADALIHNHGDANITPKLEIIQSAAVSILKILDQSLDQARLDADKCELEPVSVDPRKLVRSICELWQIKAMESATDIKYLISDSVPDRLYFDRFRYEQCFNNLMSNAVKFTENGQIRVILTVEDTHPDAPQLVLNVSDTGIGMTAEQTRIIFEPYAQADSSIASRFGGTGLGLNIVRELSHLMQGSISVQSRLDAGTSFTLAIPMVTPPQDVTTDNNDKAGPDMTRFENLNILVVDDNAANHFVIQALLEGKVGNILTADSGASAINALTTHRIDLVLMDIHMPEMDGIQTTLAIRGSQTSWANVPVVGISADPQFHGENVGTDIGMEGVIEKPVMYEPLINSIKRALEHSGFVLPSQEAHAS